MHPIDPRIMAINLMEEGKLKILYLLQLLIQKNFKYFFSLANTAEETEEVKSTAGKLGGDEPKSDRVVFGDKY